MLPVVSQIIFMTAYCAQTGCNANTLLVLPEAVAYNQFRVNSEMSCFMH